MKISELKVGDRNVNVEGILLGLGKRRALNLKDGSTSDVCDAKIADDSGEVKLSLWNSDIDKFEVGDRLIIENGYIHSFRGEISLAVGKFGKIRSASD